ncbi:MAG: BMP family ABC transporter substrate-binding protein [Thermotogae bacterium]|nr:BMP family ABC transporter substrate-binding protein [Thermotogota bacterium]
MKKAGILFVLLTLLVMGSVFADLTVIMVTDTGGLGDKSFNDSAWAGVQMGVKKLPGVVGSVVQSYEQADYVPNLEDAADIADVVVAVGFMMQDALKQVAPEYPNTKFIFVDGVVDAPNVLSFTFKEQEGAFLVGYLAAAMTKTGKVGYVGGIPIPPVKRYEFGYRAGVKAYNTWKNKNVEVLMGYVGSFGDAAKGKTMTESQFSQGADIVFAAAGLSGLGTIKAAQEKGVGSGYFGIGVDQDQDYLAPGSVLASAMKRVDMAVYYGIEAADKGTFKGEHRVIGLKEEGIGISPMTYTKQLVPKEVLHELDVVKAKIADDTIVVPTSEEGLKAFMPPALEF